MLSYLIFDTHESTEGVCTFEAMASVDDAHWPALQAELAQVLAWCHAWGRSRGVPNASSLDDGGEWDHELSVLRERSETMAVHFDPHAAALSLEAGGDAHTRWTATLVLSGREGFAADFSGQFLAD